MTQKLSAMSQQVAAFLDGSAAGHDPVELSEDVTIGISAYGNWRTTAFALQALLASATGPFDLILVDDCSPEDEVRALFKAVQRRHDNTRLFFFPKNLEYSGSLNAILSHARGRYILFLSNDIFVTPYYLREILGLASANSSYGIIRGCSNFVDNCKATHNIDVSRQVTSIADVFAIGRDIHAQHQGQSLDDEFLTGDAFLVSRAVLDKIGTFDPLFYGYFADHDFGIRARIAGFNPVLARGAFAYHQRAANFEYLAEAERNKKVSARWAKVYENWARFKLKYGIPVSELYQSMQEISWGRLSRGVFDETKHYCAAGDYSDYEVIMDL